MLYVELDFIHYCIVDTIVLPVTAQATPACCSLVFRVHVSLGVACPSHSGALWCSLPCPTPERAPHILQGTLMFD